MRARILLLIVFFLMGQGLFAQSGKRHFTSISAGVSIPLGDFAKTDLQDSTSGFAKTGVNIQFTYAYRITHNFGVQGQITYNSNAFNYLKCQSALKEANPDYNNSVEANSTWSSGGILIGPYLRFPFTDQLSWDVRALFGLYGAYSPNLIIHATEVGTTETAEYQIDGGNAMGFGYSLGTGFKYQFSKYYVTLFADYVKSSQTFDKASGWDWNNKAYTASFKQDINYLSITIGIAYLL